MPDFLHIHSKSSSKSVRMETLQGRKHYVVPMVMMTEGVHNGSGGPVYYPSSELGKYPEVWNHKPVVVYHPEMNGKPISACQPTVLETQAVGVILNSKYDERGRLVAEAWIEETQVNKVDSRIVDCITNGSMMEVSTGLYLDLKKEPGVWNNEQYDGIGENYRPDHLAILPDRKGACSIEDGAGLNRNESNVKIPMVVNDIGYMELRDTIQSKLLSMLDTKEWYPYIEELFSDFFIMSYQGSYWKIPYSVSKDGLVSIGDTKTEVRLSKKWVALDGSYVGNSLGGTMTKAQVVAAILATHAAADSGMYKASDETYLMTKNDEELNSILESSKKLCGASRGTGVQNHQTQTPPDGTQQQVHALSASDWLKSAPQEIVDSLQYVNQLQKKMIQAVQGLTNNQLTEDMLKKFTPLELENLHSSLVANQKTQAPTQQQDLYDPIANFLGLSAAPLAATPQTTPKPLPVANWGFGQQKTQTV